MFVHIFHKLAPPPIFSHRIQLTLLYPILLNRAAPHLQQEAETKEKLRQQYEAQYLNPETEEYKIFRAKVDAKREKQRLQRDKDGDVNREPPTRRPVKREKKANDRRLRLEGRRLRRGRLSEAD